MSTIIVSLFPCQHLSTRKTVNKLHTSQLTRPTQEEDCGRFDIAIQRARCNRILCTKPTSAQLKARRSLNISGREKLMSFCWLSRRHRSAWLHLMFSVAWWPTQISAGHFSRENHNVDCWIQGYALFPKSEAFSSDFDKQNHLLKFSPQKENHTTQPLRQTCRLLSSLIVDRKFRDSIKFSTNAEHEQGYHSEWIQLGADCVSRVKLIRELRKNLRRGERFENLNTDARLMARVTNSGEILLFLQNFRFLANERCSADELILWLTDNPQSVRDRTLVHDLLAIIRDKRCAVLRRTFNDSEEIATIISADAHSSSVEHRNWLFFMQAKNRTPPFLGRQRLPVHKTHYRKTFGRCKQNVHHLQKLETVAYFR